MEMMFSQEMLGCRGIQREKVCPSSPPQNALLNVRLRVTPAREQDEPSFIGESSFVHAPLNSRVSLSPAVVNGKGKARADSLDRIPIDIQEALILEDLLFVLMVRLALKFTTFFCAHTFARVFQALISLTHQTMRLKTNIRCKACVLWSPRR